MIFAAFFRALGQMSDRRFRRVLLLGIALTLVLLIGVTAGFVWLIGWLTGDLELLTGVSWLNDVLSWGGFFLMMVLSIFLMVPVASAITSMFLEEVAAAVEDKHYPHLPPVEPVHFWDSVRDTINFLGLLVVANVLALLLYALLPFASVFVFWGLNGFLLGREYFTLAAMRRVGRIRAKELRREHGAMVWLAGTLMAIPLSVPLLNLVIPILGAATFTHIYHGVVGTRD